MSEATILNAQPVRTLVKEEEMPIVNTSSTSSSPTSSNNLPSNKQESDQSDATDALSSFNKTLLDQEAHDGLLVLAQLNHQDHISDSDEDENESVSKVSALYSLLQDDSDDGEHVSSLPPSANVGTNTPSLVNTHLAKRASRMAAAAAHQQQESSTTNSNSNSSNNGNNKGSTTPKPRKRKTSRRSAMEEDEIADAGAMENDDDEYVADAAEEDDEEMALAGVKKRSSTRRERSPGLGANAASSSSNRMDTTEDEVISEEDLIHCVVCKRSNLQVNFKKNYTINTNNYKTYCDTFPQQSDQIPKPRDGESLSVCSTCYNKQWRFARGQYDPSKNRVVNKREGLKNPPKLKDSPRPGEDGGETPDLGLSTPNLLESPPPSEGKKRKVTKRRASTSTTSTPTEDSLNNSAIKEETTSVATTAEETAATIETPKKRAKRAVKAKKVPLPTPPLPSSDATATATNGIAVSAVASSIGASSVPISTLLPGTVMIANGASTTAIPSPSPNKRGRKSKNPPANIGVVSGAPATSYKKEESLSPPPPVISNTALLISYMKRINGILEEIYTTKIVTQNCPDTIEQLRDLVMERLTQKKGELFSFDRACCNSVDRFNNSIKVEVDEFFFKDVKLNNNDSLCIYVNDK